jgi:DeoR family transcriptional regulator, suf operon transcriptional repressor
MPTGPRHRGSLEGTRGRILNLLRRSAMTANELAAELGVTHNAVRNHLVVLQREGLVREAGLRRSGTRPAVVHQLVPRADSVFSRAYIPFLAQLLSVLGERMSRRTLDQVMRTVGSRLAAEWPRLRGGLRQRIEAASGLLEELGALTEIEERARVFVIRGYGCLLAEAVHGRPEVCRAMESLLSELLEAPVRECCERGEHPRCCFEIPKRAPSPARRARPRPTRATS